MAKAIFKTPQKKPKRHVPKQARLERYERFCQEYSKDANGSRSVMDAGFTKNPNSARAWAVSLLAKPNIKKRIQQLNDERNARTMLEGDQILLEIKKLAVSDIRRLLDPKTGCVLPASEWPDDMAVCVSGLEVIETFHPLTHKHTGYVKKLKLWDKPKSQENLGRNKKLFTDVAENTNRTTATVVVVDAEQVKSVVAQIEKDF
jgi:phage terminase small subunit